MLHGETVIMITQNEDLSGLDQENMLFSTDCAVQMYPCVSTDDADTVMEGISTYNIDTDNCRAYSGAIFSAKNIPANIKGLTPYLIINISDGHDIYGDTMEGVFKKLPKNIDEVCDIISKVLSTQIRVELDDGYVFEDFPNINDMYLFIGKQVELSLTVSADSIDEELIDRIDSICDAVLDGESIEISEHHEQSDGDEDMATNDVVVTVNHSTAVGDGVKSTFKVDGRLIGMCITDEALKIAQNKEVARRVHTKPAAPLIDVVELIVARLEKNQKLPANDRRYAHFVVAAKSIKDLNTGVEATTFARKLYISPPIDLVSGSSASAELSAATFECVDGTMCAISQKL